MQHSLAGAQHSGDVRSFFARKFKISPKNSGKSTESEGKYFDDRVAALLCANSEGHVGRRRRLSDNCARSYDFSFRWLYHKMWHDRGRFIGTKQSRRSLEFVSADHPEETNDAPRMRRMNAREK